MVYIFAALFCEAQPLIHWYGLKKRSGRGRIQRFSDEKGELLLSLTGAGPVPAAAAVASVLAEEHVGPGDVLLSIGSCAWIAGHMRSEAAEDYFEAQAGCPENALGKLFLLHKLVERETGRSFYPDMLYWSGFPEAACLTGSRVLTGCAGGAEEKAFGCELYDMEAAAVYQAGRLFLGTAQMQFLRLVTDLGEGESVSAEAIRKGMELHVEELARFVDKLRLLSEENRKELSVLGEEAQCYVDRLAEELHCSFVMRAQLMQCLRYMQLSGMPWQEHTLRWQAEGRLPCRDRRAGKRLLEELKEMI